MKYKRYIPYFSAVLCTAVYLSLVFNDNIWLDEAFSASIIRCGYKEMLSRTFADTLPPFYNLSAWLFTHIFGFSTIGLKIFSVLPVFLLMLVSARFLTRVSSVRASCIYMALVTGMPHFLEHGVEIRMYSWAVFFASSAAIFALCVTRKIRYAGIGLTACTVLGAYTHQYALIAEAFIWLMLLAVMYRNKEISAWLKMSAVCIILYIPCAVLTLHQMKAASSYFSAAPATLGSLFASLRYPYVTNITVLSAILMLSVLSLLIYSCKRRDASSAYYMLIYVFVTFMSFGIMWSTGSTFFTSRYLMPSIGILWLGVSVSLEKVITEKRKAGIFVLLILSAVCAVVYVRQYRTEYVDMSGFKEFIAATGPEDGYIIYEDFPEIEICLDYYAPWLRKCEPEELDGVTGHKYLFVNRDIHINDVEKIKKYELKYIGNLSFDRYTFKAYELSE